jgi:hypothetical protein
VFPRTNGHLMCTLIVVNDCFSWIINLHPHSLALVRHFLMIHFWCQCHIYCQYPILLKWDLLHLLIICLIITNFASYSSRFSRTCII